MAEKINVDTVVGTTEIACVLGITGRRVRQLAEDGVIEKVKEGRFNLAKTIQRYVDFIANDEKSEEEQEQESSLNLKKLKSEADLKKSKAKIEKLKADELEGKMHRSEDVEAMTTDLCYAIRGMLIALPGRLAVDVFEAQSAAEASEIIKKEIYAVLSDLSQYKYDPKKYEERVRERLKWEKVGEDNDE